MIFIGIKINNRKSFVSEDFYFGFGENFLAALAVFGDFLGGFRFLIGPYAPLRKVYV